MRESTLALKPRADVTRSPKQGYQWPHKKDMCPTKKKKKKVDKDSTLTVNSSDVSASTALDLSITGGTDSWDMQDNREWIGKLFWCCRKFHIDHM